GSVRSQQPVDAAALHGQVEALQRTDRDLAAEHLDQVIDLDDGIVHRSILRSVYSRLYILELTLGVVYSCVNKTSIGTEACQPPGHPPTSPRPRPWRPPRCGGFAGPGAASSCWPPPPRPSPRPGSRPPAWMTSPRRPASAGSCCTGTSSPRPTCTGRCWTARLGG